MKVHYNKGMGCPVEISDGKTATCISLDAAKELQANLSAVIEQAENTPEEELSEFEKAVGLEIFDEPFGEEHIKVIKEESAKLLAIARNEIVKSGYAIIEGEHYLEEGQKNYERGKAEALKDLPRWKPAARAYDGDRLPRIDWSLNRLVARFEEGIFYLDIRELYKLPGFKEG